MATGGRPAEEQEDEEGEEEEEEDYSFLPLVHDIIKSITMQRHGVSSKRMELEYKHRAGLPYDRGTTFKEVQCVMGCKCKHKRTFTPSAQWAVNIGSTGSSAPANQMLLNMDKDSQDVHQELNELKSKFQEMRRLISTMPGIDRSLEQQQKQLQSLREQVQTKNQLLQKYKNLCTLEIPKESSA